MNPLQKDVSDRTFSYTPGSPIVTGSPTVDMVLAMLLQGANLPPPSGPGKSVFDAYRQRQRSYDMMKVMKQSFGTSLILQKMGGMNTDSTPGAIMSMLFGKPDGIMDSSLMRGLSGGNPVRAGMGLMTDVTGITKNMMYGTGPGRIAPEEVKGLMDRAYETYYKTKTLSQTDIDTFSKKRSDRLLNNEKFKAELSAYEEGGQINFTKLREAAKKMVNVDRKNLSEAMIEALKEDTAISGLKTRIGEQIIERTKPSAMRGFELQDLTKSMTMFADLNMMNRLKGTVPGQSGEATVMQNIPGVLRAITDLTGSTTAEEATKELNAFLGNSKFDIGDAKQAESVTMLARNFKAAAQTAGISIEAIMGILADTKALASSHPALRYQGGLSQAKIAIRALSEASAMTATLGSDWTRKSGGQAAVQQAVVSSVHEENVSPMALQAKAYVGYIANRQDLTEAQKKERYASLETHLKDQGSMAHTAIGWSKFLSKEAGVLGLTDTALGQYTMSPAAQQHGVEVAAELEDQFSSFGDFNSAFSTGIESKLIGAGAGKPGVSGTDNMRAFMAELGDASKTGRSDRELVLQYYGHNRRVQEALLMGPKAEAYMTSLRRHALNQNPEYRKAKDISDSVRKSFANQDEQMSRKAKFHGRFLNEILQEVISGSSGGWDRYKENLTDGAPQQNVEAILNAERSNQNFKTVDSLTKAFEARHGGADKTKAEAMLSDAGLDADQVKELMAERDFGTKDRFQQLFDLGEKGINISQIIDAKKNNIDIDGVSRPELVKAYETLTKSGMIRPGNDEDLKNYGKRKLNADTLASISVSRSVGAVGEITRADVVKDLSKITGDEITATLKKLSPAKRGEYAGYLEMLGVQEHKLGDYTKDSLGDLEKVIRTGMADSELTASLTKEGFLENGILKTDVLRNALKGNKTSLKLKSKLSRSGFAQFEDKGKIAGLQNVMALLDDPETTPEIQKFFEGKVIDNIKGEDITSEAVRKQLIQKGFGEITKDGKFELFNNPLKQALIHDTARTKLSGAHELTPFIEKLKRDSHMAAAEMKAKNSEAITSEAFKKMVEQLGTAAPQIATAIDQLNTYLKGLGQ